MPCFNWQDLFFWFCCSDYSELLKPKANIPGTPGEIPHKKLEDIMKVELLADKTADEITKIWLDYHKEKDVLVAAIPTETFNLLMARGKDYPLFIFPLPRSQGYEFFLLQFASNTVHFTPLLCYQVFIWNCRRSAWEIIFLFHCCRFTKRMHPNAWISSTTRSSAKTMASYWCVASMMPTLSMRRRRNVWSMNCNYIIRSTTNRNWNYWNDSHANRTPLSTWM